MTALSDEVKQKRQGFIQQIFDEIKAKNIIDCGYDKDDIVNAIRKALSGEFKSSLQNMKNPYDEYVDGRNSYRIKETLKNINVKGTNIIKKKFFDIDFKT